MENHIQYQLHSTIYNSYHIKDLQIINCKHSYPQYYVISTIPDKSVHLKTIHNNAYKLMDMFKL
jgi:hypothetical protein